MAQRREVTTGDEKEDPEEEEEEEGVFGAFPSSSPALSPFPLNTIALAATASALVVKHVGFPVIGDVMTTCPDMSGLLFEMLRCFKLDAACDVRYAVNAFIISKRSIDDGDEAFDRHPETSSRRRAGGGLFKKLLNVLGLIFTSDNLNDIRDLQSDMS